MVGPELLNVIERTFLGLQIGMTLILIASGLTLIFGMMDVANIAHGSFVMIGAYLGLAVVESSLGNFWYALVLAPIAVGIVGGVVERATLKPLYGSNPLYLLLVTLGVAIIIQEVVAFTFGSYSKTIPAPELIRGSIDLGLFSYPTTRLFVFANSLVLVLLIWYGLSKSEFGVLMQASEQDPEMVQALGVDVWKVYSAVFVLSAMLAGYAGVLLGTFRAVDPGMGLGIIIQAFAIVVIGGMGSFRGAVVGSLAIGLLNAHGAAYFPSMTQVITFALMAAVLLVKPTGLFGRSST